MRVHFLYQIFSLIKLFDIWERLQGTLFLQFVRSHSVFQEIFSFYFFPNCQVKCNKDVPLIK